MEGAEDAYHNRLALYERSCLPKQLLVRLMQSGRN
jgi:hypothetical protein